MGFAVIAFLMRCLRSVEAGRVVLGVHTYCYGF